MSGSAEPCAYCAKYAAGHCIGLGAFPDLETQQQQRRLELEAQHRSAGTLPPPPPTTSGSNGLLQAFDEGDVPYYYHKDTSHTLACKYELLDTSVANPEWARDPPADVAVTEARGQMATGALRLRFDGSFRAGGAGGAAAVLSKDGVVWWEGARFVPSCVTSSHAEFEGLILGLEAARALSPDALRVEGDCRVVIDQMSGKARARKLSEPAGRAREALARLPLGSAPSFGAIAYLLAADALRALGGSRGGSNPRSRLLRDVARRRRKLRRSEEATARRGARAGLALGRRGAAAPCATAMGEEVAFKMPGTAVSGVSGRPFADLDVSTVPGECFDELRVAHTELVSNHDLTDKCQRDWRKWVECREVVSPGTATNEAKAEPRFRFFPHELTPAAELLPLAQFSSTNEYLHLAQRRYTSGVHHSNWLALAEELTEEALRSGGRKAPSKRKKAAEEGKRAPNGQLHDILGDAAMGQGAQRRLVADLKLTSSLASKGKDAAGDGELGWKGAYVRFGNTEPGLLNLTVNELACGESGIVHGFNVGLRSPHAVTPHAVSPQRASAWARGDADEVREASAREAAERLRASGAGGSDGGDGGGWADWPQSELDGAPVWDPSADDGEAAFGDGALGGWDGAALGSAGAGASGSGAAWMSPAASAEPERARRPIETVKVGRVSGPYVRRNGYHVEVRVQHPAGDDRAVAEETAHTLWISHQVLDETALLRGAEEQDLSVEAVAEEADALLPRRRRTRRERDVCPIPAPPPSPQVLSFLASRGIDLSDGDWALDDPDVPFSTQHASLRTLTDYYPDLKEHLAEKLLGPQTGATRTPPFKNMAMGSHPLSGW
ncbi:hypothetical protein EMIHUDRAFT_120241 [Emiliania huxleyi CCMP1516]|uniref:RNase H type-1 domain-containing protein n=2 Tax=Emiliania huxleyi TaxID=2903 RepID=A0A0D3IKI2_EMIH1|nr:hypothetical protein EMIHUDRAFT_120241 [Emiliania huxleyi CCMP1516]EOD11767.1 hypothetical protein EMIHUDRAFT_120241 [Emiliania huxleyi CCMP1516]|eukprot:XP_005764196.1 hypothetical protein EMIHUDRAFT_120241 [Emiliania huxleyi CCMP1516]